MKASKFFTSEIEEITFSKISDRSGWDTNANSSRSVKCVFRSSVSGIDPEMGVNLGIQAGANVFVHISSESDALTFQAGDIFVRNGVEYEIKEIKKVKSNGFGKIFKDFSLKITGDKK